MYIVNKYFFKKILCGRLSCACDLLKVSWWEFIAEQRFSGIIYLSFAPVAIFVTEAII